MSAEIVRLADAGGTEMALAGQVEQLQGLILKMSMILEEQDRRIREMEERQRIITICHQEALELMARIRKHAEKYGEKYGLNRKEDTAAFRGAIKKDLIREYGIRDLHDLPESELERAGRFIDGWKNIRLVMKRRETDQA